MINLLKNAVYYSTDRVSIDKLNLRTYISTENLMQNKLGKTDAEKLPSQNGKVTGFLENDILVANIRPYLKKIWYADMSGGSSADVLTFRVKDTYIPKFVYYALLRDEFFEHMMNGSKGTKMPRGDKTQILNFQIPFFEKNKQKKIADALSFFDKKIAINNKIYTELEAMAKLIYDYWFVQFDFPDANGKPYKSSGGTMVYNEALKREIPKGWELRELGAFGEFKNGVNYDPSKPGDIACPIINVRNISAVNYFLNSNDLDTVYLTKNDAEKYYVDKGDIIIARSGIPGATRLFSEFKPNTIFCGFAIRYKLINLVRKNQIFFFMKSVEASIKNGSGGTILKNVNQGTLKNLTIVTPECTDNLKEFNNIIDSLFGKIALIQKENQKLSELRDWLLPMLMNGQVTLKDV